MAYSVSLMVIYAMRGCPFRIPAHADLLGIFHLFTLFLEEFDYTARVQHTLVAVVVLDNI